MGRVSPNYGCYIIHRGPPTRLCLERKKNTPLFAIITNMISTELQLPITINELRTVLRKNGVKKAFVFGSYARGDATSKSDLDLLVELADGKTYLDLGGLQYELKERFSIQADIATKLNRHFEPYITPELVSVL